MVGSTISGFGSDGSDVDMCLVDCTKNGQIYFGNDLRIHSQIILKEFEDHLRRKSKTKFSIKITILNET